MAGKIIADQIQSTTAGTLDTKYVVDGSAKHWINFNGTGTLSIRNSLNASSFIDTSTGWYKSNFSNNFLTGDYSTTTATVQNSPYPIAQIYEQGTGTDGVTLNHAEPGDADYDTSKGLAQTCGDLA